MKKVFLSLAVLASVAMVSCTKKAAEGENAEAAATDSVENAEAKDCANDCANDANVELTDTTVELVDSVAVNE